MMAPVVRTLAFVRKEITDVLRQPLLLLALIVGPFLILLAFGAGLRETDPPLRTELVAAEDSDVREQVEEFAAAQGDRERLEIEGVSEDRSGALARLRDRDLDLVIVFPEEVVETVEAGEQAVITLYHNQIDPLESQAIALFNRSAVDEINNRLLEDLIGDLQDEARRAEEERPVDLAEQDEDAQRYLELDPRVVVSPFHGETETVAGRQIELTDFYAPAVIVVLLQHLAVTLLGLSVVRERDLGATALFRVSPLRTTEYLIGKFLAYLLLGGVVAAALLALLVVGLGTPMVGEWWHLVVTLGVLLVASTALGLVLSLLAQTDSQAVQYAMLVLLATIFLSGFLLSLERFVPLAQPLAWLLPATYAIQLVRDTMLRGAPLEPLVVGGMAVYGVVFAVLGAWLAHRQINRPGV
jgi:ABC-2 type transport system permease protein